MDGFEISIPVRSFKGFIVALFFIIFLAGGFIINFAQNATTVAKDECFAAYNQYQEIIKKAESYQGSYIKEGIITEITYNENNKKWYISYDVQGVSSSIKKQTTFCTYSDTDIAKYKVGSKIKIAVDSLTITNETVFIYTDFKNVAYEDCSELYFFAKIDNILNIAKIGCFAVAIIIGGCAIWYTIYKKAKSVDFTDTNYYY